MGINAKHDDCGCFRVEMETDDLILDETVFGDVAVVTSSDHTELRNRDAADQHPISSITGLADELNGLKAHVQDVDVHVTQQEKENWNNKSRVYRNASGALVISV